MMVVPAIDLKDGLCVRLVQGRQDRATVYDGDPLEIAHRYESEGAERIHIVDLDGAFLGASSENQTIIRRIAQDVKVPLEVGGGVRSIEDISTLLDEVGVRYAIIGTLAIHNPQVLEAAIKKFGDAIIVGIDSRGPWVATHGWTETTRVDTLDFARQVASIGAQRIIYTDIARDGELSGPNLEMTREIARTSGVPVTASGGVSSLEDIERLSALARDGVDSVIVGKALYEGRFSLGDAIARANQSA